MGKGKGQNPTTYNTTDGISVLIASGGEELAPNSYGFEIEFCSHDRAVFQFTHVDAAEIVFTFDKALAPPYADLGNTVTWTIETDSSNVFELVTGKMWFNSLKEAYEAKDSLTEYLTGSLKSTVSLPSEEKATVAAIEFSDWRTYAEALNTTGLGFKAQEIYKGGNLTNVKIAPTSWEKVDKQVIQENVDDDINIASARLSLSKHKTKWEQYVNATIMSRSLKDLKEGYSSQVNLPMTLQGFFLYSTRWKLPAANQRFRDNKWEEVDDEFVGVRYQTTWLWLNVISSVYNSYIKAIATEFKLPPIDTGADKKPDSEETIDLDIGMIQLKQSAFLYLTANKIITGALGSMSEKNQLALQRIAWQCNSTMAITGDKVLLGDEKYESEVYSQSVKRFSEWGAWLGFHSYLKDLTGLWFKAALKNVVSNEDLGNKFYECVGRMLIKAGSDCWEEQLNSHLKMLKEKVSEYNELPDDLRHLYDAIESVQKSLGAELARDAKVPAVKKEFKLPSRKERPFLNYDYENLSWEGRYDTMWQSIAPDLTVAPPRDWTYLIEHRNH